MLLSQAITLIERADWPETPAVWCDLGCGNGLFTQALATILPAGSEIYAIDNNNNFNQFTSPNKIIEFRKADFLVDQLPVPPLDGILMANAFHYVKNKQELINKTFELFKTNPKFLFIEYDTDQPVSHWVPYPMSFKNLNQFFLDMGFRSIKKLTEHPSIYGRANMYSVWVES